MMKQVALAGVAVLALAGCVSSTPEQPQPTVTVTAPAPEVTVTAPPVPEPPQPEVGVYDEILQEVWDTFSYKEQANMCYAMDVAPQLAWDAFNEGAEGALPRAAYKTFFDKACEGY